MAITTKLELRQSQQLVMTPQLQQAIKLLQLSNLELNEFVDAELERNPLLERDEENGPAPEGAADKSADGDGDGDESGDFDDAPDAAVELTADTTSSASDLDVDRDVVYGEENASDVASLLAGSAWGNVGQSSNQHDGDADLEATLANETSLREHLSGQLQLAVSDPVERLIGAHLIDLVDDAGYMRSDPDELAERLGVSPALLKSVLAKLQTFDPPGVMATSLKECLALQLKERGRYDPMIAKFLDHLDLLAAHDLRQLRRILDADMEDLTDMIAEIRTLNPKPGNIFGAAPVQTVIPDVLVRPASDGSWLVEVNSETLPRVLVNRSYYTRVVRNVPGASRDREFLIECLNTANWLVKSLDQRARTILRVAEEIVRQQDAFLVHGVQYLRPLNLKTVADAIKMHESTVSRVTSSKYIATNRGIFEMKYFFNSAIASVNDGLAHSSVSVRHRIKMLIDAESSTAVLSDDQIVDILQKEGIDIARRTVAKYREAMRIASSVQRRREKRAQAQTARIPNAAGYPTSHMAMPGTK
jgi:RNA polymerase sigma-54 factor